MIDQNGRFIPDNNGARNFGQPTQDQLRAREQTSSPFVTPMSQQMQQSPSALTNKAMTTNQPSYQIANTMRGNIPQGFANMIQNQAPKPVVNNQNIPVFNQNAGQPYFIPQFQPQFQMAPPPQSVEQSVQNNNPQSVQNFLSALNKVGAGANNTFMHNVANQGQQAQAGFAGFGNNQYPMPQLGFYGNTNYGGQGATQIGYQGNQASVGPGGWADNTSHKGFFQGGGQMQQGGTGGLGENQPNFHVPDYTIQKQVGDNWFSSQTADTLWKYGVDPAWAWKDRGGTMPVGYTGSGTESASDENVKKNIGSADAELTEFLNNLGAYSYEYKDTKYGVGEHVSPMAQEIEKSALGKPAIRVNEEGYKMVDYAKLAPITLAAVALLNKRLNEMNLAIKENTVKNVSNKKGK